MLPLVVAAPSLLSPAAVAGSASLAVGVAAQLMRGPYPFRGSPPGTGAKGRNLELLDALIRDAVAGARLPVAFPEPPKLPPGPLGPAELAAAAAAAAALAVATGEAISQVWGWLNSLTGAREGTEWPAIENDFQALPGVGTYTITLNTTGTYSQTVCERNQTTQWSSDTDAGSLAMGNAVAYKFKAGSNFSYSKPCGVGEAYTAPTVNIIWKLADGSEAEQYAGGIEFYSSGPEFGVTVSRRVNVLGFSRDGQPIPVQGVNLPGLRVPVPAAFVEPEPERKPSPPLAPPVPPLVKPSPRPADPAVVPGAPVPGAPAPQPPGTPAPAPAIPRPVRPGEWQPGGPGTPSQPVPPGFPAPTIAPSRTPSPLPVRPPAVPDAQPTTPGGQVIPRPQPRPPVTRPGSEVINGITIPNRPPAPTLQGIAAEVGRIEQKLAYQLRNPEDGNQDLDAKLQELLDALENQQDAGVYELGGPCERDPEGQPIPFDDTKAQFDWGGNTSALANIASRIDALAELLQYHKLLRQPSCKNPQPTGEWVTVNFRQTDFEAP